MKKWIIGIVAAGLLVPSLLLSFGCAPAAPEIGGKIVIGLVGEVWRLDPQQGAIASETHFHVNMSEGLYMRRPDASLQPALATSYVVSADGMTYTFTLRKGVKFHPSPESGKSYDFTAADVKFSLERFISEDLGAMMRSHLLTIDYVEVKDDYTAIVHLNTPDPVLLSKMGSMNVGPILSKQYYDEVGEEGFNTHPVATGPYKFVEYVAGEKTVLEVFEDYWGDLPTIKTIEFKPIPETAMRIAGLKTGELDIIQQVPALQIADIEATPGLHVMASTTGPTNSITRFVAPPVPIRPMTARITSFA